MNIDDLNAINRRQITRAGARYTPGLDPDAPNLEVRDVALALAAVGGQEAYRSHARSLEAAIRERTRRLPRPIERKFRGRKLTPERLADALARIADSQPGGNEASARELRRTLRHVRTTLSNLQELFFEKEREAAGDGEAQQRIRNDLNDLRRLMVPIEDVAEFVDSPPFDLLTNNLMLLLGWWGTGKTHSLCDLTEHRMKQGLPTILQLAHNLPYHDDPMQGICDATGLARNPDDLLQGLQRLGESTGSRALIIVDGINEGNRTRWKRSLAAMIRSVRRFTHVGVVLSCRQPFDELIFTSRTRRPFVHVEHHGFAETETDAQVEFFAYYAIPAPHAPLLAPEFSRPLFLKMFCESVRNRSEKSKNRYVRDLASGQKGMTRVLEDFAKEVGRPIEQEYGLARLTCWRFLKGRTPSRGSPVIGVAPAMAKAGRDWISREECLALIGSFTGWASDSKCEEFLQRLLADGLLLEGTRWREEGPYPVIQFSYQRFGDHLIARNLLERHLRIETESAIRRSFYVDRPLGHVFDLARGGHSYPMPGLASAIMLEFPERVKRVLPPDERELVVYLPRARQLAAPLRDVFLEGLYWRPTDSFGRHTDRLISYYLDLDEWTRYQVLEVLTSLATRPGHPYAAGGLLGYLRAQDMPERDQVWSEFIRQTDSTSAVQRLLAWIERTEQRPLDAGVVENSVILLSTCLTTTRRALRDRVTRALYLLGLRHPRILFDATLASLGFNDPYVPERMLAASYGVAMSMWADAAGGSVRRALPRFARELVRRMFSARGRERTAHVLMQDYALGAIGLARRIAPRCIPKVQLPYLCRPLRAIRSPFPSPRTISDEEAERASSALHMDFENYTLGRLVRGRGNYDYEHGEFQDVRRQILWRVADLGYSDERFASTDRLIAGVYPSDRGPDAAKVDRYGKKYSWIAFFEMYGVRVDAGKLAELSEERPSDVDIDPSFPLDARSWKPPRSQVLEKGPTDLRDWLKCGLRPDYAALLRPHDVDGTPGPWLLLDGFIEEKAKTDTRRVFTFLWARFVDRSHRDELVSTFQTCEYPGNFQIPAPSSDHYTFAGEIPWSHRFALHLRSDSGQSVPYVQPAFGRFDGTETRGIPVEIPVHRWSWESYHSEMNQVGGVVFPAPALCGALSLVNHARELDLFDGDGTRATLYTESKGEGETWYSHLLFIREDLLNRYLTDQGLELVWFVWGERDIQPDGFRPVSDELAAVMQTHANIHRGVYVWDRQKGIVAS